jgi:hypothetical protein
MEKSKQNIQCFSFSEDIFDAFYQLIANYNNVICDFLKKMLQKNQFYIGGNTKKPTLIFIVLID